MSRVGGGRGCCVRGQDCRFHWYSLPKWPANQVVSVVIKSGSFSHRHCFGLLAFPTPAGSAFPSQLDTEMVRRNDFFGFFWGACPKTQRPKKKNGPRSVLCCRLCRYGSHRGKISNKTKNSRGKPLPGHQCKAPGNFPRAPAAKGLGE